MQLGDQQSSGNVENRARNGDRRRLGRRRNRHCAHHILLGFDPSQVINVAEQVAPQRETREAPKGAPQDEMGQFVSKVLGSTEVVWGRHF